MLTLLHLLACATTDKAATPGDDTGPVDAGDTSEAAVDTADTGNADTGNADTGDSREDTTDTGVLDTATDTGTETGAADTGTDTGTSDLCDGLAGSDWSSVDELECGRTPDGVALCHWRLSFSARDWSWHGSDYAEAGTWTCTAGSITSDGWDGRRVRGVMSDATHLTWDGTAYVRD